MGIHFRAYAVIVMLALAGCLTCSAYMINDVLVAAGAACRFLVPTNNSLGTNWTTSSFNDASWSNGTSGIGYDKETTYVSLLGTQVPTNTVSFYSRFRFSVSTTNYLSLTLRMKYDDGFVAYLNGTKVAQPNGPASTNYNATASGDHPDSAAAVFQDFDLSGYRSSLKTGTNILAVWGLNTSPSSDMLMLPELEGTRDETNFVPVTNIVISEFMAFNDRTITNRLGKYADWIEIHNRSTNTTNLAGWHLTDDPDDLQKWTFPYTNASTVGPGGFVLVWADDKDTAVTNGELHANFKLDGEGEYLALVQTNGATIAYAYLPEFPPQYSDISYGIGAAGEQRYFGYPTPGASNNFSSVSNQVKGVQFDIDRGLFTSNILVTITSQTAGAEIRYTLDDSLPRTNDLLYAAPLSITSSTVIRAAAFKSGQLPSEVDTHTYVMLKDVLRQPTNPPGFPATWYLNAGTTNVKADYAMDPAVVGSSTYGPMMTNAVQALPFISIVTTKPSLFDQTNGIYVNSTNYGIAWERAASAEYVLTNNVSGFQINCGLRIQGHATRWYWTWNEVEHRWIWATGKKSFTLRFRGEYGAGRLECDTLFDDPSAVSSFNDLVIHNGIFDAWTGWAGTSVQFLRNEFAQRTQLAMGRPSSHGTFAHVYLDGLYWGIYNVCEKLTGDFAADYFGGDKDGWDVFAGDGSWDEGDGNAWNALWNLLSAGPVSNGVYQKIQGNNPDRTRNLAYPVYLDVDNFIDYQLMEIWCGTGDWGGYNLTMMRYRDNAVSTGFKFLAWDSEGGMGNVNADLTVMVEPTGLRGPLMTNAEFRLQFGDHVQKHLFNGGALTPEATSARYQKLANLVEPAIVAESARWGDQRGGAAKTVDQWRAERDRLLGTYFPQRTAVVVQQLRTFGLYPGIDAPVFNQFGGLLTNGFILRISAASPIYYTLDGTDPRQYGSGAALGTLYNTNGLVLARTTHVKARAMTSTNQWSALIEAVFTKSEASPLRLTEVMYHPYDPAIVETSGYAPDDFEFIELRNTGSSVIGLAGIQFTAGVVFDFTDSAVKTLNPGEYVLVVKNRSAFTELYTNWASMKIAGEFGFSDGNLANGGEQLELVDGLGRPIAAFAYDPKWHGSTDGGGHSLIPLITVGQTNGVLDYGPNWRASAYIDGSPGAADPAPVGSLMLNEVMAHTDVVNPPYDSDDWIELYNPTPDPIALGAGWYLSDSPNDLRKWQIPATHVIAAGGWLCFNEIGGFHNPITSGFGLDKAGEEVYLSHLPGNGQDRIVDSVMFSGEEKGRSLGRYPDGHPYWSHCAPTPNASNQLPAAATVRISEIMYHPRPTAARPENNENDEFVELHNPSGQPAVLMNVTNDAGVWRLAGGIDYTFPSNTVLPAHGYLAVVPFDPASDTAALNDFLAAYGFTTGQVRLLGPYEGHLDNRTEQVRLERPVYPDVGSDTMSWHAVDQVTYLDQAPWPLAADGAGCSLNRRPGCGPGDDPAGWFTPLAPTPGREPAKIAIACPARDTGYLAPFSVEVAADVDGTFMTGAVAKVEFHDGATLLYTDTAAPYGFTLNTLSNAGVHGLTARLVDGDGTNVSPTVAITVYTNAPSFEAGKSQAINLNYLDRVNLRALLDYRGIASDQVRTLWSVAGGGEGVTFGSATNPGTSALFTQPGTYVLSFTMQYGLLVTNDNVTVTVTEGNVKNQVPYRESFEGYVNGTTLAGLSGWEAAAACNLMVTSKNYTASYTHGYPIEGPHELALHIMDVVSNGFENTTGHTNTCIDMIVECIPWEQVVPPQPGADCQFGFYADTNQHLVAWHGQTNGPPSNRWTQLPQVHVGTNEFVRMTLEANYTRSSNGSFAFRMWINGIAITNPATWYATASTNRNHLSWLELRGQYHVDDLVVEDYNTLLYRRIDASSSGRGQVLPCGRVLVPVNTSTNFSITPSNYCRIAGVVVDGTNVGAPNLWTFTNVTTEHVLTAAFVANLTTNGTPEWWLNRVNGNWTNSFDAHALEDADGDGARNWEEYVGGTEATNGASAFRLNAQRSGGLSLVSFATVLADPEYAGGQARYYGLETSTDLVADAWTGVPGWIHIPASGQTVVYTNQAGPGSLIYLRGKVWLGE